MVWAIGGLIGWLVLSGLWSTPFEFGDFVSMFIRGLLTFLFVVAFAECQFKGQLRPWLGRALVAAGLASMSWWRCGCTTSIARRRTDGWAGWARSTIRS